MIAKNIKGKGFAGCVRYVMNETAELLEAEGVLADSAESIIHSFAMQRSMRSEITKPVGHIPISFAPEDKPRMTSDFMLQLAKEYMQRWGSKTHNMLSLGITMQIMIIYILCIIESITT